MLAQVWRKIVFPGSQTLGQYGEELAQEEYKKRGYKIVAANFFNKKGKQLGEVDFIAVKQSQVIFVEVKTRASETGKFGTPAEAVNIFKQQKLLKAVKLFLNAYPKYAALAPQIDVCVVICQGVDKPAESVTIIPSAVEDSA